MSGLVGGPLLMGGVKPGLPAPPLKSVPDNNESSASADKRHDRLSAMAG